MHSDGNQDDGIVEANNTFLSDNDFVEQMEDKNDFNSKQLEAKLQESDRMVMDLQRDLAEAKMLI